MKNEVEILNRFLENRDKLIDMLKDGKITKTEYIEACFEFLQTEEMKPFKTNVDSIEKSMFNYQYYNTLAKYSLMKCEDYRYKDSKKSMKFYDIGQNYYNAKDRETMKLLELIEYKNVCSYYVNIDSDTLKGELFEIILLNYDRAVFHSKDKRILNRLKKNGVFDSEPRVSIIDKYVNTKYA